STAKFNQILKMDKYSRTAVVQPGVRNLAISEAAAPHGLYYAPDPSSQIACSIGGNVAENSGGVHCLKYGLTVHNVLRVRMV
ncbi:FAD-binding protein, partial [Acinetobacter baumannii]